MTSLSPSKLSYRLAFALSYSSCALSSVEYASTVDLIVCVIKVSGNNIQSTEAVPFPFKLTPVPDKALEYSANLKLATSPVKRTSIMSFCTLTAL